jgi:uncharacterized protein with HEPN domain
VIGAICSISCTLAQLIQKFVHGISRVEFDGNDLVRSAVTWQIVIIGGVAKRLSAEARAELDQIPWRKVAGMRDVVIHDYDDIRGEEVWRVASESVPMLIAILEPLVPPPD